MKILLIAPLYDIPTITSNIAVEHILEYAGNKFNIDIDLLWGIMANRFAYSIYNKFKKYDAIFYWGHGEANRLLGTHIWSSIINTKNVYKVRDTIIDTMACHSLKELGKKAIDDGVKAYIGTDAVYYAAFPEKERNFLADWIDYTTARAIALLDGKTMKEAYDIFIQKATYYLKIYKSNINYGNYDWYYETLLHNINHTKLLGDENARLY